ncbi:Uncharacterised protein [Alloiococcus otitis]|uniref:Uncharacterized protein n=1 Tax=Alloiococcus otitis ATCC 51267 TaxID=883081 RepID=K9EWR6_9LACT|nr:hypothetical protein HMPREF9698_00802 [Alloiococcus otitis ATCC 51267]SUU80281.1 Uncharacterised protein [Alloiococcus otitis]
MTHFILNLDPQFENFRLLFLNNLCYSRIFSRFSQTTSVIRELMAIFLKQRKLFENFPPFFSNKGHGLRKTTVLKFALVITSV